ncbi:conserved membrane hypothetical protein [Gammaproteobacteria bacterium]
MKRTLLSAALILTLTTPIQFADAALMRNAFQSCAFGAGAMASTTYLGLTPALSTTLVALPVTEVIAANALIGCGIGVAGATAATLTGWLYDVLF